MTKQTRARNHLNLLSRWARKFLSHTIAVLCCQDARLAPLAFPQLLQTRNAHTGFAVP